MKNLLETGDGRIIIEERPSCIKFEIHSATRVVTGSLSINGDVPEVSVMSKTPNSKLEIQDYPEEGFGSMIISAGHNEEGE